MLDPPDAAAYQRPMAFLKGETGDWEIVLGLEVHAQVISDAKLLSVAPTAFGADPTTQASLVDADLPQGYQISQSKHPIVGEGEIEIDLEGGKTARVGIERLHLEQDAGKSLHDQHPSQTYVDLNRSGVALMEIVSKPDMRSADEAKAYVSKLRTLLRYIGSSDGDMEKGNLRADVNVSVRRPGEPLGTRCEIKNVNSIRFIGQAIEVEARRQVALIEDGGVVEQETRLFDPVRGETRSLRSKEEAHDYRYFPDPDLLPLEFDAAF